jgi:surfactin synthase thioesterase subunit
VLKEPLASLWGMADCDVQTEDLAGWQAQTSQPISLHLLSGNHYFVRESLEALCRAIVEDFNL